MILIFGGAYSGKKEFAISKFSLKDEDIFDFENFDNINNIEDVIKKYKCLYNTQYLIKNCISNNIRYDDIIKHFDNNMEKIIISDDISCGIVPLERFDRSYREENSRFLTKISDLSNEVYRVFAGIPIKIK